MKPLHNRAVKQKPLVADDAREPQPALAEKTRAYAGRIENKKQQQQRRQRRQQMPRLHAPACGMRADVELIHQKSPAHQRDQHQRHARVAKQAQRTQSFPRRAQRHIHARERHAPRKIIQLAGEPRQRHAQLPPHRVGVIRRDKNSRRPGEMPRHQRPGEQNQKQNHRRRPHRPPARDPEQQRQHQVKMCFHNQAPVGAVEQRIHRDEIAQASGPEPGGFQIGRVFALQPVKADEQRDGKIKRRQNFGDTPPRVAALVPERRIFFPLQKKRIGNQEAGQHEENRHTHPARRENVARQPRERAVRGVRVKRVVGDDQQDGRAAQAVQHVKMAAGAGGNLPAFERTRKHWSQSGAKHTGNSMRKDIFQNHPRLA